MTRDAHDKADPLLAPLLGLGPLRVWSVVITIFGDLSARQGVQLSGADLRRLTAPLLIRPDALRVAIHRLRQDGWINSARDGRNSLYSLTRHGFEQCHAARSRIYAHAPAPADDVRLLVLPQDPDPKDLPGLADAGLYRVAPRLLIGARPPAPPLDAWMAAPLQDPPHWLQSALASQELRHDYARLDRALQQSRRQLEGAARSDAAKMRALRILVVHRWRQLLLRHPDLPASYFGPGWKGERCRERVLALLDDLPAALPDLQMKP